MNRVIHLYCIIVLMSFATTAATSAVLPSTVTTGQWRDSYLAKWQSGNETDRHDAVQQLSALLILTPSSDAIHDTLADRLAIHVNDSPDAQMALAFHAMTIGNTRKASQYLLDLILQYPGDSRINRFRIALARAFRADKQFDLASAQLEPLLSKTSVDGRWAILEKARLFQEMGRYEDAVAVLTDLAGILDEKDYLLFQVRQALAAAVAQQMLVDGVAIE